MTDSDDVDIAPELDIEDEAIKYDIANGMGTFLLVKFTTKIPLNITNLFEFCRIYSNLLGYILFFSAAYIYIAALIRFAIF